eukprot:CAMPEP_0196593920 /NCGR_PEP_ID=MMETSP1081-20130531/76930_1 /TAXON_ID=36882 /ORGANISM="Pyramimonas amylifera, Strain CCMP720" /LENGTH=272 /DNA_ID=CAMNT_0041918047 /DNA_START=54 /DNA_END=872 /DNA_ORIENTATION=+
MAGVGTMLMDHWENPQDLYTGADSLPLSGETPLCRFMHVATISPEDLELSFDRLGDSISQPRFSNSSLNQNTDTGPAGTSQQSSRHSLHDQGSRSVRFLEQPSERWSSARFLETPEDSSKYHSSKIHAPHLGRKNNPSTSVISVDTTLHTNLRSDPTRQMAESRATVDSERSAKNAAIVAAAQNAERTRKHYNSLLANLNSALSEVEEVASGLESDMGEAKATAKLLDQQTVKERTGYINTLLTQLHSLEASLEDEDGVDATRGFLKLHESQ